MPPPTNILEHPCLSDPAPAGSDGRDASRYRLPDDAGARSLHENWYALRTRSRHEAMVCDQLLASDVQPFCPVVTEVVKWTDRDKPKITPWFPGYVFARFDPQARLRVLAVRGVIEVLSLDQKPCPISDEIIANLRRLADSPAPVLPHAYVVTGSTIRVKCGPFADCTGVVVRTKGTLRLVVAIPMLGQAVSVELDCRDVEPDA